MKPIDRLSKTYNDKAANTFAAYIDGLTRNHSDKMTPELYEQILTALETHKPMQLRKIFNLADYKAKDGNINLIEPMRRFKRGEIDKSTYDYITRAIRFYWDARTYKDDVRQQHDDKILDTDNDKILDTDNDKILDTDNDKILDTDNDKILDTDNDGDVDKTDVSNIAKAITYRDLGRQLDNEKAILDKLNGIY